MEWLDEGVVLSVRPLGETAVVASLLTQDHGRHTGLVRGGASRRARGMLQPGNKVRCQWRGRLSEQLGAFTCELAAAPATSTLEDAARLAALVAACAVLDTALPEREPLPAQYKNLLTLLRALAHDPSWPVTYVRWEASLLADLGFGLDLASCALTGTTHDLAFVSPRTGRAVSAGAGAAWRQRLLVLPAFLVDPTAGAAASDIAAGLTLTGHFLSRYVYREQGGEAPAARERLPATVMRAFAGHSDGPARRG